LSKKCWFKKNIDDAGLHYLVVSRNKKQNRQKKPLLSCSVVMLRWTTPSWSPLTQQNQIRPCVRSWRNQLVYEELSRTPQESKDTTSSTSARQATVYSVFYGEFSPQEGDFKAGIREDLRGSYFGICSDSVCSFHHCCLHRRGACTTCSQHQSSQFSCERNEF